MPQTPYLTSFWILFSIYDIFLIWRLHICLSLSNMSMMNEKFTSTHHRLWYCYNTDTIVFSRPVSSDKPDFTLWAAVSRKVAFWAYYLSLRWPALPALWIISRINNMLGYAIFGKKHDCKLKLDLYERGWSKEYNGTAFTTISQYLGIDGMKRNISYTWPHSTDYSMCKHGVHCCGNERTDMLQSHDIPKPQEV